MIYDSESNRIILSADELSEFAYQRDNTASLMQRYGFIDDSRNNHSGYLDSYQTSVELEKNIEIKDINLAIRALADIVSYNGNIHTIETVKTLNYLRRDITPFSHPEDFAKAVVSAYLFADTYNLTELNVKLTFQKQTTEDKISFVTRFSYDFLSKMFEALISRAAPFIEFTYNKSTNLSNEINKLPFPYTSIREGQEKFIKSAYNAITHGNNLIVSAPTGIGKTISSVYPAVKALGKGKINKVFYVTAKTITGKAAIEAVERLGLYAPHLRAVAIYSKEQVCPLRKASTSIVGRLNCRHCERLDSVPGEMLGKSISYREREISALSELISMPVNIYNTELISTIAEKHSVCPYELSLDISEYCSIIVCDYNYVIDDNIRFKRYFKNPSNKEKYAFLFDEAHNLTDRTRNTYSAVIDNSICEELKALAKEEFFHEPKLAEAVSDFTETLNEICNLCRENEYYRTTDNGEVVYGYYESSSLPTGINQSAVTLNAVISKLIREESTASELLAPYYDKLSKLIFAASYFDEKFRFFASRENEKLSVELLCIDPSGILEKMLSSASSVILFSATLSPIDYYKDVIGMKNAEVLELNSPYEKNNLCIIAYDSISTKLSDRRDTAHECAEVIVETISQKTGNYIVYFPSYEYMKRVCKVFARLMPECAIVMQKQGMSYRERERFINVFRSRKFDSVVGFCVLGGMFSEGIDLAGESLIGAIVVGTGMPSISAERNIMEAYYNENNGRGHEFAYDCPGMNKVMQAAGRVIRSENDCGIVVLIDDRYSDPRIKMLFPPHWRHMKYTGNLTSLSVILSDFWSKKNGGVKKAYKRN